MSGPFYVGILNIDPYAYTDNMLGTGTKSQDLELNALASGQRNIIAMENGPFLDGLPKNLPIDNCDFLLL